MKTRHKTKSKFMNNQTQTLPDGIRTSAKIAPLPGGKPTLLIRLLLTSALSLLSISSQADVVFTNLYSFTGTNDGATPNGLVQGSDGYLYGTTANEGGSLHTFVTSGGKGGSRTNSYYGFGTVFKISTNGALTTLYVFGTVTNNAVVPIDGGSPRAGLVQGSDGNFYGTTYGGGANGDYGTVFQISTNCVLTTLYSFGADFDNGFSSIPLDGENPVAALVQGSDGSFYGTTEGGGDQGDYGTVFKITTNGVPTNLYSFDGYQGYDPRGGLVQGGDGNLYGTTWRGGIDFDLGDYANNGTLFKISTNGVLTSSFSFNDDDGALPSAGLMRGSDGNFYGTTKVGGTNFGFGTVFKVTTNEALTSLYSFADGSDGSYPVAGLVQDGNGILYGTTYGAYGTIYEGGTNDSGTVFKINPDGTGFTTLYSFSPISTNSAGVYTNSDGASPEAALILVGNTLYGTTSLGGSSGVGTVFSLTLPVPPPLSIIADGANVVLTWPANATGFNDTGYTLECATNLVPPIGWQTNSTAPIVIGGQNFITNPISGSQMFFRLSQ
jgi:uncharacterized repeat protein (TIGR03803 family)